VRAVSTCRQREHQPCSSREAAVAIIRQRSRGGNAPRSPHRYDVLRCSRALSHRWIRKQRKRRSRDSSLPAASRFAATPASQPTSPDQRYANRQRFARLDAGRRESAALGSAHRSRPMSASHQNVHANQRAPAPIRTNRIDAKPTTECTEFGGGPTCRQARVDKPPTAMTCAPYQGKVIPATALRTRRRLSVLVQSCDPHTKGPGAHVAHARISNLCLTWTQTVRGLRMPHTLLSR